MQRGGNLLGFLAEKVFGAFSAEKEKEREN